MADNLQGPGQNGNDQNGSDKKKATGVTLKCACEFPRVYRGKDGRENGTIKKVMRTEFLMTTDGAEYTRFHVCDPNPNEWRGVIQPVRPKTPPKYKCLWVVRQRQIGKNPHWSLFAATDDDSDTPKGRVWQVNGDPDVGMFYAHRKPEPGIEIFISASFMDSILVCDTLSDEWEAKVDEIANTIKAPGPMQSPNKDGRKVDFKRGTCRTWVWQVLDQLVEEGITTAAVAAQARELQPKPLA